MLDVNSENGDKHLTNFISKQLLTDIDVKRGGDGQQLVEKYDKTFNN